jgi:hypothetical protein
MNIAQGICDDQMSYVRYALSCRRPWISGVKIETEPSDKRACPDNDVLILVNDKLKADRTSDICDPGTKEARSH